MIAAERWLFWLLRIGAVVLLLATFAIFLPTSWMQTAHHALGIGELPDQPIIGYLTRSLSAMYAYHGLMIWMVTTNLRQYRAMVRILGVGDIVFGIIILGIDLFAGMPWYWTLGEGPSLVLFGLVILILLKRCERDWQQRATASDSK